MASGRLVDYLGKGLAADRPVSLTLHPDALGLYYSTDTGDVDGWDGTMWVTLLSSSGDVVGPASSVDSHVALFDGITGKLLKDGGALGTAAFDDTGDFATAAQGATADTAVQPGDLATVATTGDVDDLIGFPGGSTNFLRADGVFAAPPSDAADIAYDNSTSGLTATDVQAAIDEVAAGGGGGGGGLVLIGSDTAGVGGAASLTVGSIPGTYTGLLCVFNGRGTTAANFVQNTIRFNGDTGTNYDSEEFNATGTSSGFNQQTGQTSGRIGYIPGSTATANRSGSASIHVPEYVNTTFDKLAAGIVGAAFNTAAGGINAGAPSVCWRPATPAAITSVTMLPASGNYVQGSTLRVYGLP